MTDRAPNKQIAAYLAVFETEARRLKLAEWREIGGDVAGHINEAVDYGRPLDEVLNAMGRPEALARAYALELLMQQPSSAQGRTVAQWLRLAGLVAVGGVITPILVVALGSVGLALALSGLVCLAAGLVEAFGVHFDFVQLGGVSPWVFVVASPALFALGLGALWLLARYVRFAARQLVRAIPARQPALAT